MPKTKRILMLLGNYDPATHRGIARASRSLGWHLNVSMLSSQQIPTHWDGDGIICSLTDNVRLEQLVKKSGLPCVDLSAWRIDLDLPRISASNQTIGRLAAEHFISYGHKNFGWFCHRNNTVAETRFNSFKKELKKNDLSVPKQLVGKKTQDQHSVEQWLSGLDTPCALFAYNDNAAAWLMNICLSAGFRVPEDFAIVGVDNNPLICDYLPVPLSSVNHDHERIGYEGALLLDQIINGKASPLAVQYINPNGITLRASTDALAVSDPLIRDALLWIQQHLREPIGTNEIANIFDISRRNLEMRFQKTLNTSVHKKVVELRLKQAEHLLCKTTRKIEDIAALTGFCHAPHLCRAFKQQYRQPPLAYRKSMRAE
ncbi:AraC family transcriptional regulator [Pontiella sulfatireligans]|uniref:Xylose operon regulatory protein n=1 Tax=Pontiella sulfatireligans TaxID=2750658 RepID=A0A6C2UK37_9BACT|nr:xylose operon transcription regulator XylR [Pontiella sulfatireligans]VGO20468.1 Xylose operon regulatory protein [Pontiella sulfatireligans]